MFIYFSKRITASCSGQREVHQACEQCQAQYKFTLFRSASAIGDAPYYLFIKSVEARVQRKAEEKLSYRLENDVELVVCPRCGWVNESAVAAFRKQRYLGLRTAARVCFAMVIVLLLASALLEKTGLSVDDSVPTMMGVVLPIVSAVVGIVLTGTRAALLRRIDPNVRHPQWPVVPAGTPIAELTDGSRPARRPEAAWDGWITVQSASYTLPDRCCVCMGRYERAFALPFKVNENSEIPVPTCRRCNRRLVTRWWLLGLGVLTGAALVCLPLLLLPLRERSVVIAIYVLTAATLFVVGLATLPGRAVRPYRLRNIDASRGIFSLSFVNDEYGKQTAALNPPLTH